MKILQKIKQELGAPQHRIMVDHEVKVLISGKLGPVAFHILKNAGIRVYKFTSGSVEKNLNRFKDGKLDEITSLSGRISRMIYIINLFI